MTMRASLAGSSGCCSSGLRLSPQRYCAPHFPRMRGAEKGRGSRALLRDDRQRTLKKAPL